MEKEWQIICNFDCHVPDRAEFFLSQQRETVALMVALVIVEFILEQIQLLIAFSDLRQFCR